MTSIDVQNAPALRPKRPYPNRFIPIALATARYFGLSVAELRGSSRAEQVAVARQIACYVAHRMLRCSTAAIARRVNRDPSSVAWALQAIKRKIANDPDVAAAVHAIGRSAATELGVRWSP